MAFATVDTAVMAVSASHWADNTVSYLLDNGIISLGEFSRPDYDRPITRGEFIAALSCAMNADSGDRGEGEHYDGIYFVDVGEDSAYYAVTARAKTEKWILGYEDGTFRPESMIERQELFVVIARAMETITAAINIGTPEEDMQKAFADYSEIAEYAKNAISNLVSAEVVRGYDDNTIRPRDNITCAEAFVIIERFDILLRNKIDGNFEEPAKSPSTDTSPLKTPISANASLKPPLNAPMPTPAPKSQDGGGNSSNAPASVSGNDSVGLNQEPHEPVSDVDAVVSLDNISVIRINHSNYGYFDELQVVEPEDRDIVISFLRSLDLEDEEKTFLTGGGFVIDMTYRDGHVARIVYGGLHFVTDDKVYPVVSSGQPYENLPHFDPVVGTLMIKQYKQLGHQSISGVVAGTETDIDGRVYCNLKLSDSDTTVVEITDSMYFDATGAGSLLPIRTGDIVEIIFSIGGDVAERTIITGREG
jgi:hypothetical protein